MTTMLDRKQSVNANLSKKSERIEGSVELQLMRFLLFNGNVHVTTPLVETE